MTVGQLRFLTTQVATPAEVLFRTEDGREFECDWYETSDQGCGALRFILTEVRSEASAAPPPPAAEANGQQSSPAQRSVGDYHRGSGH